MAINTKTITERLSQDNSTYRNDLLELAVDYAFTLPLETVIDVDDFASVITEAITDINAEKLFDEEILPLLDRLATHFQDTNETPRDLLPEGTANRLIAIVSKGKRPKANWAKGSVDVVPIRGLIAPIVQDVLMNFTRHLPIPGLGGDGGESAHESDAYTRKKRSGMLGKAIRKGAGSLADISKTAMGSLGGELERKIQTTTREFSANALVDIRKSIQKQLASPEGQEVIRETRISITNRFLDTPIHILLEDLYRLPLPDLTKLVPPIAEHNRVRPQLRTFIEHEVGFHLEKRGKQSVGELLDEFHLKDELRKRVLIRLDGPVQQFTQSKAFKAWLKTLLA